MKYFINVDDKLYGYESEVLLKIDLKRNGVSMDEIKIFVRDENEPYKDVYLEGVLDE